MSETCDTAYLAMTKAFLAARAAKEAEKDEFKTKMTLTIGELQELLGLQLSCDLRTKLAYQLRRAQHDFSMRNVDFGDLEED